MTEHWIEDDRSRKAFWATAAELGLNEEQAREALGLGPDDDGGYASTREYVGSWDDAVAALARYADADESAVSAARVRMAGEAPVILYSQCLSSSGWEINFTVRGADVQSGVDEFGRIVKLLKGMGCRPLLSDRYGPALAPSPAPGNGSPQSQPAPSQPQQQWGGGQQAAGAQQPQAAQQQGSYTNLKTGRVTQIEIRPDGQMHVHADNAKWPLKDSRGADAWQQLFDDDVWSQEFPPMALGQPGYYQPGGLVVEYGKSSAGYWDILRVRRG